MGGGGQGCSDLNALYTSHTTPNYQPLGNPYLRGSSGILQRLKLSPQKLRCRRICCSHHYDLIYILYTCHSMLLLYIYNYISNTIYLMGSTINKQDPTEDHDLQQIFRDIFFLCFFCVTYFLNFTFLILNIRIILIWFINTCTSVPVLIIYQKSTLKTTKQKCQCLYLSSIYSARSQQLYVYTYFRLCSKFVLENSYPCSIIKIRVCIFSSTLDNLILLFWQRKLVRVGGLFAYKRNYYCYGN